MSTADKLRAEIAEMEQMLSVKRRQLERAETRNWEVAWYQQLLLIAGCAVEPETLEDGLTEEEAQMRRVHWASSLADGIGVVVIARISPSPDGANAAQ